MVTNTSDESVGDVRNATLGLVGVVSVAWIYLFTGAAMQMPMSGDDTMSMQPEWTWAYAATVLAMWAIMMVAMMLPVGAPAIIGTVRRPNRAPQGGGSLWTGLVFAAAYISVWLGFGVAAMLVQWRLDNADILSENMSIRSGVIASLLAVAVGLYQFSSLKLGLLRRCRSSDERFPDNAGRSAVSVWKLGLAHGASCLGCCWALMLLPFAGGLMNPFWMAGAMLLALAERIFPKGDRIAKLSGAGLLILGGLALAVALR